MSDERGLLDAAIPPTLIALGVLNLLVGFSIPGIHGYTMLVVGAGALAEGIWLHRRWSS